MSTNALSHSHPVHPALVHFPITFLLTSQACDVAYYLLSHPTTGGYVLRYDTAHRLPTRSFFASTGYLTLVLGLVTGLLAVVSGGYEFYQLLNRQAYLDKVRRAKNPKDLKQKTHPKVVTGFVHAVTMDLVMLGMAYNWWTRRNRVDVIPDQTNVAVSAVVGLVLGFGSFLGGQLVYTHGVGVELAGKLAGKHE